MKPLKTIRDPEAFQLLADETRRKMVFLLRAKEMTVSQISAELGITSQAVYHHVKKLLKAKMIEVSREERIDHLIESYYRATAEVFSFSCGETVGGRKLARRQVEAAFSALRKLGFDLKTDEKRINELLRIQSELDRCDIDEKLEDGISRLNDVDFLTRHMIREYAKTLSTSDKEFVRKQELRKMFRDLVLSFVR